MESPHKYFLKDKEMQSLSQDNQAIKTVGTFYVGPGDQNLDLYVCAASVFYPLTHFPEQYYFSINMCFLHK